MARQPKHFFIFVRLQKPEGKHEPHEIDPKRIYGPFTTYLEAHEYGRPFAEEGFDVEMHTDVGVCDFCSNPDIRYGYDAKDFRMFGNQGSRGGWAACEICHDLIEANEREVLAAHSLEEFFRNNPTVPRTPVTDRVLLAHIWDVHRRFFLARTGEAKSDTSEFQQP